MEPEVLVASLQSRATELLVPLGEQYDALASNHICHVLILIGHCIACVQAAPDAKGNFLLHYIMTFVLGFGGAMWSSLLLMTPSEAPISWIKNNDIGLYFTLTWWLVVYSPLSRPLNWLLNLWPVKVLPTACVLFFKSRTVVARVELVASVHPGVLMSPLVLATIAGCGGMCTYDALRAAYGLNNRPAEVTMAGKSFRVAFLVACIHFGNLLLPQPLLPRAEMRALLTTLCVGHALVSGLTGLSLDWTAALMRPLLFAARIPWPTGAPLPFLTATKTAREQQEPGKKAAGAAATTATAAAAAASPSPQTAAKQGRPTIPPVLQPAAAQEQQKRKGAPHSHPILLEHTPSTHSAPAVSHFSVANLTGLVQQGKQQQQLQQQQGGKKGRRRWGDEQAPAADAPAQASNGASAKAKQQEMGGVYVAGPALAAPNPFAALQDVDESGKRKKKQ